MSGAVLVTGGAGYIGALAARRLLASGYHVVVLDDLSAGHRWAVPDGATFVEGDVADGARVRELIAGHGIDAVMHFAAHIVAPESVVQPLRYYRNNVGATLALLQACAAQAVPRFILSSTAAVYGEPARIPVCEDDPTVPINPYGASKLVDEWMLRDAARAGAESTTLRHVILRYFNVAGAALDASHGQAGGEATHLIRVASQAACGLRENVTIHGIDYDTADGTCVRDYIHVEDLVDAHLRALRYLEAGGESQVLNCGYGHGATVREVLDAVQRVSGARFPTPAGPRRPGDAPTLVADCRRIREVLGWQPRLDDLDTICRTAVEWERRLASRRSGHSGSA